MKNIFWEYKSGPKVLAIILSLTVMGTFILNIKKLVILQLMLFSVRTL